MMISEAKLKGKTYEESNITLYKLVLDLFL